MDTLRVTVIGQDLFNLVEEKFEEADLIEVSRANKGMLGNLKMLIYEFDLEECEIIRIRKNLLESIAEDHKRMRAYYEAGSWMDILVIRPLYSR